MKASVFCIGTELVEGQTINRNAPWISERLKTRGLPTSLHLVVPDERRLMREGLEKCAAESDLIFVTGGLGPTSDDFTRDIVAEWMGAELEFHTPSWQHLTERLTARHYAVKEIQRQQCYFPRGSEVLFNSQGTANAFYLEAHGKKVFVLPGPPKEIAAVWKDYVEAWLDKNTAHIDPLVTYSWDTLGKGESEIATLVEEILRDVHVDKGYRVHLPYVEVKMTFLKSQSQELLPWVEKVEKVLAPITITRNGEDVADLLAQQLQQKNGALSVVDEVTGSFLLHRLLPVLRPFIGKMRYAFTNQDQRVSVAADTVVLKISDLKDFRCHLSLQSKDQNVTKTIESPYKTENMHERMLQYFAEQALVFWQQNLH